MISHNTRHYNYLPSIYVLKITDNDMNGIHPYAIHVKHSDITQYNPLQRPTQYLCTRNNRHEYD